MCRSGTDSTISTPAALTASIMAWPLSVTSDCRGDDAKLTVMAILPHAWTVLRRVKHMSGEEYAASADPNRSLPAGIAQLHPCDVAMGHEVGMLSMVRLLHTGFRAPKEPSVSNSDRAPYQGLEYAIGQQATQRQDAGAVRRVA